MWCGVVCLQSVTNCSYNLLLLLSVAGVQQLKALRVRKVDLKVRVEAKES